MLGDDVDDRAADDHTIGDARDGGGLFGRPHAKAHGDGRSVEALSRVTASSMLACAACCLPVIPATET